MKAIILDYYSRSNYGDDLFAYLFTLHFGSKYRVKLFGNPFCKIPAEIKNRKVNFTLGSYLATIFAFVGSKNRRLDKICNSLYYKVLERTQRNSFAYVKIGGSIFMDRKADAEISFGVSRDSYRNFSICSQLNPSSNCFIIGANLGPVYHEQYWTNIRNIFSQYAHVTLRDFSSYSKVADLKNTQYAPDLGFMAPIRKQNQNFSNTLLVSLVYAENYTQDSECMDHYYNLVSDLCKKWVKQGGDVVFLSLCEKEGDMKAINRISSQLAPDLFNVINYSGNITEILDSFANAKYVICSRFHSMIMSMLYKKPFFPISYNCKMDNYLLDLQFDGKSTRLSSIKNIKIDDMLFNYEHSIICDCSEHIKYAKNQFWGLETFLKKNCMEPTRMK